MENQPHKFLGYRDLNDAESEAIDAVKDKEKSVADLWKAINDQFNGDVNPRWMNIAKTHFEEGFSAFVKAVARPHSPFDNE
jgi:hypothetical protein